MYSCVYKCVCKQFSERLYNDLLAKVAQHLQQLNTQIAADDPKTYIEKFNFALNQYLQALGGIVPIFNYMNRFYVESKLGTDLRKELLSLFKIHVVDHHAQVGLWILI
jgi:predicted glycosyltransferase